MADNVKRAQYTYYYCSAPEDLCSPKRQKTMQELRKPGKDIWHNYDAPSFWWHIVVLDLDVMFLLMSVKNKWARRHADDWDVCAFTKQEMTTEKYNNQNSCSSRKKNKNSFWLNNYMFYNIHDPYIVTCTPPTSFFIFSICEYHRRLAFVLVEIQWHVVTWWIHGFQLQILIQLSLLSQLNRSFLLSPSSSLKNVLTAAMWVNKYNTDTKICNWPRHIATPANS